MNSNKPLYKNCGEEFMAALCPAIQQDLLDLFKGSRIESAVNFNLHIGENEMLVSEQQVPMYFNGDYTAETVLVMLNPGNSINRHFSFTKSGRYLYDDFDDFVRKYLYHHINYGEIDYHRHDNFDLKQAAFLRYFGKSDFNNKCDFQSGPGENEHESRLNAKCHVLMNKLQLEFIPYCSSNFRKILDNSKQVSDKIDHLTPYVNRMLDAIFEHERTNVVFCSNKFALLFKVLLDSGWDVMITEKMYPDDNHPELSQNTGISFSCQGVRIIHNGKHINALIANTFPSQALPNAYGLMGEYGKWCYNRLIEFKKTLNDSSP